uniref:Nas2 N-terminal domain-containing protein n=1 Tax=Arcella intermedia TaxID=1963864 RepID=A0A6B2LI14_9EUKA
MSELVASREKLESEIEQLLNYLNAPGNPGLKGGLVDEEGFPIADVEKIISVREARGSLARKKNDHTQLMKDIEDNLYKYHQMLKDNRAAHPPGHQEDAKKSPEVVQRAQPAEVKADPGVVSKPPFAKVMSVAPLSPAFEGGLKALDLIVAFGWVDHSNHLNLAAIKNVVSQNISKAIPIQVSRNSELVHLNLTPHTWQGPGVLGCHLVPL